MLSRCKLDDSFYARPARIVARELLGKTLVRRLAGEHLSGRIVETEAYCDSEEPDLACHGTVNRGRPTPRTQVMFGPAGHAYVYFTYGIHWMFNVVTGMEGQANAVLIRALEPLEGEHHMACHRGRARQEWTNGPAKLTQALAIDGAHHGTHLSAPDGVIWIENAPPVPDSEVSTGARIGLGKTPEPWLSIPWRFWITKNSFVSR